jgi:hypothetical protein
MAQTARPERQDAPPMVAESLVVEKIRDQIGASGWKRQSRMEMGLMDRQRPVDGSATATNDDCARECQVDQPCQVDLFFKHYMAANPC